MLSVSEVTFDDAPVCLRAYGEGEREKVISGTEFGWSSDERRASGVRILLETLTFVRESMCACCLLLQGDGEAVMVDVDLGISLPLMACSRKAVWCLLRTSNDSRRQRLLGVGLGVYLVGVDRLV